MNNTIALRLGGVILLMLALDFLIFGTDGLVFLGKKMLDLIEWMAFWR